MLATRTASSSPPAPAGLTDEREAACIRGENSRVTVPFVTTKDRVTSEFSHEFVRRSTIRFMPRPRILLVHGSVVNGDATWAAQRPLGQRFELVVPNRRGFPPGPEIDRVDYDDEAVWLDAYLEPGTHLVGHSYGGVIALLAAARRPELLRSLTVVEPPAMRVARGDPAADEAADDVERHWEQGPRDPEAFLRGFLARVGTQAPPGRFSEDLLQGARLLMVERYPWRAEIPLDELAATSVPEAGRLRRAQPRLRGGLRRARGTARRPPGRPPRRGPCGAAARRAVQRAAGGVRRAGGSGGNLDRCLAPRRNGHRFVTEGSGALA